MAQNYTRQSSFADGDTITAALFNNEFNQVVNAFSYSASSDSSTGHKHDGTAGQGGNIPQIGDIDFLNKIVVDNTNNRWGFYVQVSSGTVEQLRIQDGAIVPVTNNDIDLGTSSLEFKDLFIDGTAHIDTLDVDVNATVAGTLGVTGATTLSSTLGVTGATTLSSTLGVTGATTLSSTLGVTGAITGSSTLQATTITATTAFVPDASDGASLGTVSLEFSDLFLADGALIAFGNDQDVTITHLADAGLLLNGARGLFFNDTTQYINAPNGTTLDIAATDEIELNATLIDINGAVDISGTVTATGTSVFASLDISGDIDVDGTTNLDVVDIDGAVNIAAATTIATDNKIQFRDTAIYVNSSTDGQLDIVADTEVQIAATTVDINGAVDISGNLDVGGNLVVTGTTTFNGGTLTMGDAATDNVVFGADINSNIIPNTDDTYDLGSSSQEWRNLYIDGTANIDSLVADTADINGGTIDGATIATSDITVGSGKTLNVSAGTLTLADNQISGDKVEGGTIAATTITTLTSTTGNITSVNATTVDTTNLEVTTLKAKDGTAAGSIADSTGVVTLASSVLTTTDINGGTVDGVTIGGSSAGDITYANLSDGTITITAFADEDDMSSDSATLVPTQQSVKAYVDSQVGTVDTLSEILANGNTTGSTDIAVDSAQKVQFRDAAIYLNSSVDGQLDIVADTEIQIAATTVDLNGNLDVSGTALVAGVLTTTAATVFNGGFASNADSTLGTDKKVQFRDAAIYINSSADGQLDIVADTEIQIAATTIDINGAINASGEIIAASLDISGNIDVDGTTNLDVVDIDGAVDMASTLAVGGVVTANAGVVVDNFTLDGTTLALSSGSMTLDSASQIILKAAGGNFQFLKSGTEFARIFESSSDFYIYNPISDKDIKFYGNDGGSEFTALTLDMSDAGTASFNHDIKVGSGGIVMSDTFNNQANNANVIYRSGSTTVVGNNATALVVADSGTTSFGGVVTANAGVVVDNFTLDGTTLALSSGSITLDSAAQIILDGADDGTVQLHNAGTKYADIYSTSGDFYIKSTQSDKDIKFQGNDGGSGITALTLDMSTGGTAYFSDDVRLTDNHALRLGNDGDIVFYHDNSNGYLENGTGNLTLDVAGEIHLDSDSGIIRVRDAGGDFGMFQISSNDFIVRSMFSDADLLFKGNDGGSVITALTLDMSEAGAATFNSTITTGGNITIGNTSLGQTVLQFLSATNGANTIHFGDGTGTDAFKGYINYNHTAERLELVGSGDITLDAVGTITLDADNSGTIYLKDGGTNYGQFFQDSNRFFIQSQVSDADMLFRGSDAGDVFTALLLDMSDAGAATFSNGITLTDGNLVVASGHGIDFSATAGSGTSELLDDYEEGAWTPVTNNGSWTVNSAGYTKVGNMVTCQFKVTATATIASNDFTGLPFVPAVESGGVCGYQNSEAGEVFSIAVQSSNVWNFRVGSDQKGLASGALVYGAFTYQTTA
jgi:fibronectin-binding autotransporter adhesin